MWTRKELKTKAKAVFMKSYWKMVLVSLILLLISGGLGAGNSYRLNNPTGSGTSYKNDDFNYSVDVKDLSDVKDLKDEVKDDFKENDTQNLSVAMIAGIIVGVLVVILVATVIGILISVFIINPLLVGIRRFFSKEMYESTKVKEIAYAFDHSYANVAKVMFFKDLYTFLWILLFIIPGIVKAYEYRMIPYILGENSQISKDEAFALSKKMMTGEKWNAFVLDLSFIGWNILSVITLGLLSIFYAAPYQNLTNAALYNKLAEKDSGIVESYDGSVID